MKQGTTGVIGNGGTTPNSKNGSQPEGTRFGGNEGTKLGNSKVGANKEKKGCCWMYTLLWLSLIFTTILFI
jgi:uncharacterized protein with von Willebrand factor type A (vWA) domain